MLDRSVLVEGTLEIFPEFFFHWYYSPETIFKVHASEMWIISKDTERRINALEMWYYRRMNRIKWTEKVTNAMRF